MIKNAARSLPGNLSVMLANRQPRLLINLRFEFCHHRAFTLHRPANRHSWNRSQLRRYSNRH